MATDSAPDMSPADRFAELVSLFPPQERTLPKMLERQAERFGTRALFQFGENQWTYAQTLEIARRSAWELYSAGVGPGDRVAVISRNRPEFLQLILGCAWLGAVIAPVNPALRGAQLTHVLSNSAPRILAVESASMAMVAAARAVLPGECLVWEITEQGIQREKAPEPPVSWIVPQPIKPSDLVAILYTSGTTGAAKGVCCPQAQFFWWGLYTGRALGIRAGDVLLTTLPLFHTNALNAFFQALLHGCTYVLEPRFSATTYWDTIRQRKATVGYLLGAMAAILLTRPADSNDKAHPIRVALGGAIPARVHRAFLARFGVPLLDGYASTETNAVFASKLPPEHPGTMGYLLSGAEAAIVDDDDNPVGEGEVGELLLRPTQPFSFALGYFNAADKTVEAWRNLWFHTGDLVARNGDGHYRFVDRKKEIIRRRGENISSWEVERVLMDHPAIAACAVYAVPAELGEDEVATAIQLKEGCSLDPVTVLRHCEESLAYFAVPRYVCFRSDLPLTDNGKIRKAVLREAGITADMWDREAAGYQLRR